MPIRIKPTHNLGPCTLTLESIQGITQLVNRHFPTACSYSASDSAWEVYGEHSDSFLNLVSKRDKLDSFAVEAASTNPPRKLGITFDPDRARIKLVADPDDESWFEHFIIDLRKHILRPSFLQVLAHVSGLSLIPVVLVFPFMVPFGSRVSIPYSRIIIHQKPRSEFAENVKANLFSNVIWVIIGVIITILGQYILRKLGVDRNPF